jgi:hypothetical protein
MATETAEVRRWAAKQGIELSERGPIPRHVRDAYSQSRRKRGGRTAGGSSASRRRRAVAVSRPADVAAAEPAAVPETVPGSGVPDLAGGLRTLLDLVEAEVRSVNELSDRTDELVTALNAVREEHAQRLLALDGLRSSATDSGLSSFLGKLIRPRAPRVPEVVPERLSE